MGQLTITLSDKLEKQIRNYSVEHGFDSVSDFVRDAMSRATVGLPTYWERSFLAHLMEIKKLQGAEINEELLDALKGGYPKFYSRSEYSVSRDEMPEDQMEFVMRVLEMYAQLQYSYKESGETDSKIAEAVIFPGFDGNAGDGHLGFLQFLLKHDKYTYVQPLGKGYAINSHSHVTSIYQRMLSEYKTIKQDPYEHRPLTFAELKRVLSARVHPENR